MKQGRTLSEVMAELKRQEDVKRDYISPAASLELQSDGSTLYMNSPQAQITTSTQVISRETLGTTELFHRQMGSALILECKNIEQACGGIGFYNSLIIQHQI